MKTNWVFKDCDSAKRQARGYWRKKENRLSRLLSKYAPDLRRLRLTLHRHPSRNEWRLRGVMHLPTGTLVAENACSTMEEAIDAVVDELSREIRRHNSKVRKDHLIRKRRRRREDFAAAIPLLSQDANASDSDSFAALLIPHMDQIYDQAKRELEILESEEVIPSGELSPRDIVDDVLVRACENYHDRPHDQSIDVWLVELMNHRLDELRHDIKPISLVEREAALVLKPSYEDSEDGSDLDDMQFWLRQALEPSGPISLDELLPDDELSDIWSDLSQTEQTKQLDRQLREFPKRQRQALILHYGYGFELDEIATALNCDDADIRADLLTGQEKLRQAFSDVSVG